MRRRKSALQMPTLAVNGEKPDVAGRAFLALLRQKFESGVEIPLTGVAGTRKEREVKHKAPGRIPQESGSCR